jgi:glycosyltransferase involved in cell wall biosynthesis
MRILWLSHLVPFPPKGGALQRSYNLLREVAHHHEVHLVAFVQGALLRQCFIDPDDGLEEARSELSTFCANVQFVPIPVERHPHGRTALLLGSLFTRDPYTINWLKSREMHRAVRDAMSRTPFDAVHFDTISLVPYARHVRGKRTVLTHHNVESHMILRRASNEHNWLKKAYMYQEGVKLRRIERATCPAFAWNVTCSALDSERLLSITKDVRIVEVPNGVDLEYFLPTDVEQRPESLIFAGRLSAYPNRKAARFIVEELWPRLKDAVPGVSLDLVGSDPPDEAVHLARRDECFRVHGFVDDIRPYLQRAKVFLCPITDGGGTKLKILDALAMEKAIVADPIACEGIDVVDGISVLFASTPEEYVDAVKLLLENANRRAEMGRAGRALVRDKYSYAALGRKLAETYECD